MVFLMILIDLNEFFLFGSTFFLQIGYEIGFGKGFEWNFSFEKMFFL